MPPGLETRLYMIGMTYAILIALVLTSVRESWRGRATGVMIGLGVVGWFGFVTWLIR